MVEMEKLDRHVSSQILSQLNQLELASFPSQGIEGAVRISQLLPLAEANCQISYSCKRFLFVGAFQNEKKTASLITFRGPAVESENDADMVFNLSSELSRVCLLDLSWSRSAAAAIEHQ